jgi:hypothetical protein
VIQASSRIVRPEDIEKVGKSPLDETGKYPVNEYGEKRFAGSAFQGTSFRGDAHPSQAVADLDNHVCRTRVNPSSDVEPGISRFRAWR